MRDAEKTIGNIIDKQKICHISSVDSDGFPNTKAMLKPRKRDGIKCIYLSTNTSSMRVSQFRENPKACLYFTDSRFFRVVMLLGTWESGDTIYYPQGVTDPDYCVLKFTAVKGRYYSNFKSEDFEV